MPSGVCVSPLEAAMTFSEHWKQGWNLLIPCLSFKLGTLPMLLKMGEICLLLIRLALSTPRASGVISLDKWTRKEWMLCLSANLIQPLSTTKLLRQRKSPGKFTKRFSPHWLLEQSTPGQSCAKQDQGYVWFHSKQTLHQSMSLHLPGWRCANHWNYLKVEVGMI